MNCLKQIPSDYLECCPVIDEKYKVLFKLGAGRFSKVKMGLCLSTNQRVAIKIMNDRISDSNDNKPHEKKVIKSFLNEIKMCAKSKHKNIIQVLDFNVAGVYRTPDGQASKILYYVMKIAQNGQLFRLIKESELFSQKVARFIFRQLVEVLEYLHQTGVAHCDIKAQNILLDRKMGIKLIDFGYSRFFVDETSNKILFHSADTVGTIKSNAPQLTNNQLENSYHGDQVDLFACGCLLFEMVMKSPPFKSSNYKDDFYQRLIGNEKDDFWKIFSANFTPSDNFKDLIQKLLDPNPKSRLKVDNLKKHPWYLSQAATVKQYRKDLANKLKKIGGKIRKEQQQEIKNFFKAERSKREEDFCKLEDFELNLGIEQEFQKEIMELQELMRMRQNNKSESSSNVDPREEEQRRNLL